MISRPTVKRKTFALYDPSPLKIIKEHCIYPIVLFEKQTGIYCMCSRWRREFSGLLYVFLLYTIPNCNGMMLCLVLAAGNACLQGCGHSSPLVDGLLSDLNSTI